MRDYNKLITQSPQPGDRHKSSIQLLAMKGLEYIGIMKNNPYLIPNKFSLS